jgi:hypothetical protein
MIELARMLERACVEVLSEGGVPECDAAVAILSQRVGFLSPADSMTFGEWRALVSAVARNEPITPLTLNPEAFDS